MSLHPDIVRGDCLAVMRGMDAASVDTIITDPPYGLEFMGKEWDKLWRQYDNPGDQAYKSNGREAPKFQTRRPSFVAGPAMQAWHLAWATEALRVAKSGAFLLAFGGTRTFHRLTCAIEDAGWEIRDCMMWLYGSGFPKSHDISKAIDKAAGAEREVVGKRKHPTLKDTCKIEEQANAAHGENTWAREWDIDQPATDAAREWDGYGTALKPAWEPIIVAMKPLDGTFAANAQKHGVAGLWIDGGRIVTMELAGPREADPERKKHPDWRMTGGGTGNGATNPSGRWPANFILSHHPDCQRRGVRTETVEAWDCMEECPVRLLDEQSGERPSAGCYADPMGLKDVGKYGGGDDTQVTGLPRGGRENAYAGQTGGASRFFYTAKASRSERERGLKGRIPCIKCGGLDTDTHDDPNGKPQKCIRNGHPTVKPVAIMRYLARLTKMPTGGVVLDPFAGSGTTAVACVDEDRSCILIEKDEQSCAIAKARADYASEKKDILMQQKGLFDGVCK